MFKKNLQGRLSSRLAGDSQGFIVTRCADFHLAVPLINDNFRRLQWEANQNINIPTLPFGGRVGIGGWLGEGLSEEAEGLLVFQFFQYAGFGGDAAVVLGGIQGKP
ncbi:MAG: hypothetical protein LBQ73_07450, partial [Tannerellaceae bacterium]|nr:hypothetical protein [Tannerellaceae bacterium]